MLFLTKYVGCSDCVGGTDCEQLAAVVMLTLYIVQAVHCCVNLLHNYDNALLKMWCDDHMVTSECSHQGCDQSHNYFSETFTLHDTSIHNIMSFMID